MGDSIAQLSPGRMRPSEACWRVHAVLVESGTPREALLRPKFWSNVSNKLRPLDRLEVMDDDGTWLVVLMVRAVSSMEALVTLLWQADLTLSSEGLTELPSVEFRYEVRWRGHRHKWTAMLGETVLREGFDSREECEAYIRDHAKTPAEQST